MKKLIHFAAVLTVLFCIANCKSAEKSRSTTSFSGSSVERGRPAADLGDYRLVYYEPVEVTNVSGAVINESDDPFIIADWGPRDELPQEIKKPSIYVVFSQPVVPLAKLGEPIRESAGLFTIEPPLTGIYRWYGTRLLSFEPDVQSMPQQRYTITVSDKIKSLGGKSLQGSPFLDGGRSFSFETERLSILNWQLGETERWVYTRNVHPEDAKHIRLVFSYPVNMNEIANWKIGRAHV